MGFEHATHPFGEERSAAELRPRDLLRAGMSRFVFQLPSRQLAVHTDLPPNRHPNPATRQQKAWPSEKGRNHCIAKVSTLFALVRNRYIGARYQPNLFLVRIRLQLPPRAIVAGSLSCLRARKTWSTVIRASAHFSLLFALLARLARLCLLSDTLQLSARCPQAWLSTARWYLQKTGSPR